MKRNKNAPNISPEELLSAWVRDHGEAVTVKEAARLLGVHPQTIYRRIATGIFGYTPDKRLRVRDLCAYANGFSA